MSTLSQRKLSVIEKSVEHFTENRQHFEAFAQSLIAFLNHDKELAPLIHFLKYRIKDPDHLREKLIRKAQENGGEVIGPDVLFSKVTDLAGIRLIHLHTEQLRQIHTLITAILIEQKLELFESPQANCWDVEYEKLFTDYGIETRSRESMYTTVHYVIVANQKTHITCELQVRTLMDEVWGEVSHKINYPRPSVNQNCIDQLKVLARLTSGCTRLVDSIFKSHENS